MSRRHLGHETTHEPMWVSRLDVAFVRPDGSRTQGVIAVGRPFRNESGGASCPVRLEGLYPSLSDMTGQDELQALLLAVGLLERLLRAFVDEGGEVRFHDGGRDASLPLDAYFGPRPTGFLDGAA